MGRIQNSAWLLAIFSAILQILIFPLPNLYVLGWVALAPLLVALLRARKPAALQVSAGSKLLPASPVQGFLLGYVCGIIWYAGTCYWIFSVMRNYGGVNSPLGIGILFLFCLYLALYHGFFGLLIALLAEKKIFQPHGVAAFARGLQVAVELARGYIRITGFPWDLLGISQVDNIPLARLATATGVYGLSFEIMVVNVAFAAAFLLRGRQRKAVLTAAFGAAAVLQAGRWVPAPVLPSDHTARLVQANIPILEGSAWTRQFFNSTLDSLASVSLSGQNVQGASRPDLIVWPENPAPFYTGDPLFRYVINDTAQKSGAWMLVGGIGMDNSNGNANAQRFYNSGALVSPTGANGCRATTKCILSPLANTFRSKVFSDLPVA